MKSLKILVVDDNHESCDTLTMLFKALDHDAETVYSGADAITKALSWKPDLIILDIGMPGMSGWDVSEVLRREATLTHLKIFALSGYSDSRDIEKSKACGMHHHFVKPLDIDEFWKVLAAQGIPA